MFVCATCKTAELKGMPVDARGRTARWLKCKLCGRRSKIGWIIQEDDDKREEDQHG